MGRFDRHMRMADLVEADYHLLSVLGRLGIDGSFGRMTVEEACRRAGLDTDTFMLMCEVYADPQYAPSPELLRRCHPSDVMRYLHHSHDYYLNSALVRLASAIERLIAPCHPSQQKVIWKFFTDYKAELDKHFEFEEGQVIPYVQDLLIGRRTPGFSIDRFEENHSNIDEKLSDLKKLVMNSLPSECDGKLRLDLLNFLFVLQHDLARHTCIEDGVLVPMVRLIEDPGSAAEIRHESDSEDEEGRGELSDREKEILVSVAQGLLNKEIADRHNISINTVITHRKNITRKTGIKTVAGLTVYAILNGLLDINSVE